MPDPPRPPRPTLGELADRVLAAADPDERARLVAQLARGARSPAKVAAVADRFLSAGAAGRAVFLEWAAHARGSLPPAMIARVTPLLADDMIPAPVRVAAAARVLRALPDQAATVKPVLARLTAGLSGLARLDRLRRVQHATDKSRALDAVIARRERRLVLDCPRCGVRLPRVEMVKHLWHAHGLTLESGRVSAPRRQFDDLKGAHAETHDTTLLDRAALIAGRGDLRAWAAASDPPAEDTAPLLEDALDRRAGLCPACFADLPDPTAPLPPPLVLSGGRLSGDGYVVEVGGSGWLRTRVVEMPAGVYQFGRDRGVALGSRGAASFAAAAVIVAALSALALLPVSVVKPIRLVVPMLVAASAVYAVTYLCANARPSSREEPIDTAWAVIAPRVIDRCGNDNGGSRFLTRLCRASVGCGNPHPRAAILKRIEELARGAPDSAPDISLLAAASFLQVDDGARLGRDRVAGVSALAALAFGGDLPFDVAEAVAECFLTTDPEPGAADRARFRVLLLAAAFDAGLKPRDLTEVWAVTPYLRRAMAVEPLHRLGLLYGVWGMRGGRRWERVAPADTVFDLCRVAPTISGRVLAEFPDLLLYARPDATHDDLGPVLICARGVAVSGRLVGDPDADVSVSKSGRVGGGYVLSFGRERIALARRPPADFADTLRQWLRFRATALLPHVDGYLERGTPAVGERVMRAFSRPCADCGTVSAVAAGMIGKPLRDRAT